MSSEHLLQLCPLQDTLQKTAWPQRSAPGGEAVQRPGSPKEHGSICERSWRFCRTVVIGDQGGRKKQLTQTFQEKRT